MITGGCTARLLTGKRTAGQNCQAVRNTGFLMAPNACWPSGSNCLRLATTKTFSGYRPTIFMWQATCAAMAIKDCSVYSISATSLPTLPGGCSKSTATHRRGSMITGTEKRLRWGPTMNTWCCHPTHSGCWKQQVEVASPVIELFYTQWLPGSWLYAIKWLFNTNNHLYWKFIDNYAGKFIFISLPS
jgi:hypothetical protein